MVEGCMKLGGISTQRGFKCGWVSFSGWENYFRTLSSIDGFGMDEALFCVYGGWPSFGKDTTTFLSLVVYMFLIWRNNVFVVLGFRLVMFTAVMFDFSGHRPLNHNSWCCWLQLCKPCSLLRRSARSIYLSFECGITKPSTHPAYQMIKWRFGAQYSMDTMLSSIGGHTRLI